MFREAAHYARMAWGLREAVSYPAHQDPDAVLQDQLRNREARFLEMLERIVFARADHPLRQMLAGAGCELGDVRNLVRTRGLEPALETLRAAGVYVSHEEFKGHEPIVRHGRHIPAVSDDFLNPFVRAMWQTRSAGSRSAGTVVSMNLDYLEHRECYYVRALSQYGLPQRRWLLMAAMLPASHGFTRLISSHKSGFHAERWFAVEGGSHSAHYRLATQFFAAEMRLLGVRTPPVSVLPPNDFSPVARDIAAARAKGRLSLVTGGVSAAVRVAASALEHGLDISGARFQGSGEALSAAKAEVVRRAGAEIFATYQVTEMGVVGLSCPHYAGENTVHHFHDAVAIVTHPMRAPGSDVEVNSMLFTTLLPASAFFVINLELGDHGVLEKARCGCVFARLGFDTVITDIFSYSKLTGHGTTLVGNDVLRILEEVLPARFGGSPPDYQLVEEEAGTQTRIVLRVNPRIGTIPADAVRECFLGEIRKLFGGALTSRMWSHARSVEVIAEPPIVGRTGKVLPLQLLGSGRVSKLAAGASHAP